MSGGRTAGLKLSVGQARPGTRLLIALVIFVAAAAAIVGGRMIASTAGAISTAVAIVFIEPLGIIGVCAAAFIVAPHSRYGTWLDEFVPRLGGARVAAVTLAILWSISSAIVVL